LGTGIKTHQEKAKRGKIKELIYFEIDGSAAIVNYGDFSMVFVGALGAVGLSFGSLTTRLSSFGYSCSMPSNAIDSCFVMGLD
jgi:hypothetical protein